MRIGEHDAVDRRKPSKIVGTLRELVLALAIGGALFGHRLIERHDRPAAAVREQHDLGDAGLLAQERDALLHVERQLLEVNRRLVVLKA
jgi:hypothetical protein